MGYEYDLCVFGGGSGGLAAAKQAAHLGAKVALFDYVTPSPQGSKWGIGGTCVNVGCVPKKLMHYAALLGAGMEDAKNLGWKVGDEPEHDWATLVEKVQNHIKMLNFGYRVGLKSAKVTYINALARLGEDGHTVTYEKRGETVTTSAAKICISVGGRPTIPDDVPGAKEYAITSDDIFSLNRPPGKTLVVGAAYIALECAGFLNELGYNTTIAVRSILLRGFDQQCAEKIGEVMEAQGCKFVRGTVVRSIVKADDGKLEVTLIDSKTGEERLCDKFDTVMYATGRTPCTRDIGLKEAGVLVNSNGKIPVELEQTNVPHIYAIGDCTSVDVVFHEAHWANPELTPLAIKVGTLLANRLYGGKTEQMDYTLVPTTVFTPVEYGTVGLSEADAIKCFGEDAVETYLFEFTSLELQASHRLRKGAPMGEDDMPQMCLSKLVCKVGDDRSAGSRNEKVVGYHFVGPNAGEQCQGFALALRLGATKADFDSLVGIHPTDAESFCSMDITRRSGLDFVASGGCGGGKCG